MRATEFIRGLLDLIDDIDNKEETVTDYEDEVTEPEVAIDAQYSNSPDTQVTPIDTILSIGNDVNKPKNPSDLRTNSLSLYPNYQHNPRQ